jgi:hypothetical protein
MGRHFERTTKKKTTIIMSRNKALRNNRFAIRVGAVRLRYSSDISTASASVQTSREQYRQTVAFSGIGCMQNWQAFIG